MQTATVTQEMKFEDFREELLFFLARRFGSIPLAERICGEMKIRIEESDILALMGEPKVYLSSYGLSVGMQFLQDELRNNLVIGGKSNAIAFQ